MERTENKPSTLRPSAPHRTQTGDEEPLEICSKGAENLIRAIVRRAKEDYLTWPPDNRLRQEAKRYILSQEFEALSGLDSEATLDWLDRRYSEKYERRLQKWREEH